MYIELPTQTTETLERGEESLLRFDCAMKVLLFFNQLSIIILVSC